MEPFRKYLIDTDFLKKDVHGKISCATCHGGDPDTQDPREAHEGLIEDPSHPAPSKRCGTCHAEITRLGIGSLHTTLAGIQKKIDIRKHELPEKASFVDGAVQQHCMSCHATCGGCHVSRPAQVGGGLAAGHRFLKRPSDDESCIACHGTRVGDEYRGRNPGMEPDVHSERAGMPCVDCHGAGEMHGKGQGTVDRYGVSTRPRCTACHDPKSSQEPFALTCHAIHRNRVSCQVCHALPYKNCFNCHVGKDPSGMPVFTSHPPSMDLKIGLNPQRCRERPERYVTLRHVPVTQGTFDFYGPDGLKNFDRAPTWKPATPHSIRRRTPQNARCTACHGNGSLFLSITDLRDGEAAANKTVLAPEMKPLPERHPASVSRSIFTKKDEPCLTCHRRTW
ncbi:MAG: hypothetical protein JXO48_12245 [Deltaproteobacteria bacterium]|nr:hypothetical protein [Deltaproteobacteria bacterium]